MFDFRLFIGGQLFGRRHAYKKEIDKTLPASRTVEADGAERETGKRLFRLRRDYPQLDSGDYRLLENGRQNVICLARFDASEIVIALINVISAAKQVTLSLADIISGWQDSSAAEHACYTQDLLLLKNPAEGWMTETKDSISAQKLLQGGISVSVEPRSCQVIRLCLCV